MTANAAWAAFAVAETSMPSDNPETAFDRLFRAEYSRCVGIAQRVLGERAGAEDVAQEVFLSFHRRQAADAPWAPAWLHAAAAHRALNVIRGEKRRTRRETAVAGAGAGADADADPAAVMEAAERQQLVRRALRRLPVRTSTVLVLRHSGLSYAEVAAAVGCKAGDVGTMLRRGETALRKEVDRDASQ